MAGDWLAACKDLPDKPEVHAIANATGWHPEHVAARLVFRVWATADGQTDDGFIPHWTVTSMEEKFALPVGFLQAMQGAGWLIVSKEGVTFPNFRRWMGKSAKSRLAKSTRQAKWRAPGQNVDASVDARPSTKASTTEPNQREPEKTNCPDKPGTVAKDDSKAKDKHPSRSEPDKAAPRKADELFDAVAEVTASDPKVSGSHIGRICKALRSADPPYTPAEVRKFAAMVPGKFSWHTGQLTLGMVGKYIGIVRAGPQKAKSEADLMAEAQANREKIEREQAEARASLGGKSLFERMREKGVDP